MVAILAEDCGRVSDLLAGLSEEQFARPTRCEPWDVKELAAHLWRSLYRIPVALDDEPPAAADTDGVTYWRSYDPADSPVIAENARETASTYETGGALAGAFARVCAEAAGRAGTEDPARLIRVWWGPALRLDEFLKTRVLETVVHGLDMTDALGRDPVASAEGLALVADTLTALLGHDPPAAWSAMELVEKGTGRTALSPADAAALGARAAEFPLLR